MEESTRLAGWIGELLGEVLAEEEKNIVAGGGSRS